MDAGSTIPDAKLSAESTGLKAGLMTFSALIAYFMVMKYYNFMDSAIAWAFNFVLRGVGIILAFRYYSSRTPLNVEYIPGLILGTIITATAVFAFAIFIYFFFSQDTVLLPLMKNNVLFMGEEITPSRAAFATAIEGLCSGILVTFIVMQYFRTWFKRKRNEKLMHG